VLIRKEPVKNLKEAKSHGPIQFLPFLTKALKHIIVARICQDTDSRLSTLQRVYKEQFDGRRNGPRVGMDCLPNKEICPGDIFGHIEGLLLPLVTLAN